VGVARLGVLIGLERVFATYIGTVKAFGPASIAMLSVDEPNRIRAPGRPVTGCNGNVGILLYYLWVHEEPGVGYYRGTARARREWASVCVCEGVCERGTREGETL
jgi:hypothetical protein